MYLDVITQFPKHFKEVQDLVKEPLEKRRENRRAFFEREIAPAHESMEVIHKDYSIAFAELLDLFEREGDVQPRGTDAQAKTHRITQAQGGYVLFPSLFAGRKARSAAPQ